ncbi:hypothetical protein PaecuDRAFT_2496 [Paenibacillus curdlanolyticus YK9]|uniref:Uncharacterized protein n=1 Tax=Paenibacillus curdlanolyticus YK9 TaxID=717606 RepID=E0IA09_9BACL|nr:hypothetical protein [Paenibacillus curdlanolyticus]EFM10586.1 hypothetical protein PaecuDRAFT_2496 [Paenibacillus curdlanolyticus YK9]
MLRTKREIIVVVIPAFIIREFIAVDLIGSTALYYGVKLTLKKLIFTDAIAMISSIIIPILYKKIARRLSANPDNQLPRALAARTAVPKARTVVPEPSQRSYSDFATISIAIPRPLSPLG